jgi:hypothetical protein
MYHYQELTPLPQEMAKSPRELESRDRPVCHSVWKSIFPVSKLTGWKTTTKSTQTQNFG